MVNISTTITITSKHIVIKKEVPNKMTITYPFGFLKEVGWQGSKSFNELGT